MASMAAGPDPEQAVVQAALARGLLTREGLREALLLREQLAASGRPATLLSLVAARVPPARLAELRAVYAESSGSLAEPALAPTAVPPDLAQRATVLREQPSEQDPAAVRDYLRRVTALADRGTVIRDGGGPPPTATAAARTPGGSPLSGGRRVPPQLGPYAIERELARGGQGAVLIAQHVRLQRRVALKVLLSSEPSRLRRFEVEARATARLRHPNIVPIHDVGADQGIHYLVMDLIDGESLQRRIERDGPLEPRAAAALLEKIARAVYYAHTEAILHRDLKPANVLIDAASGEPLVTDFGLAKEVGSEEALTRTGARLGTPAYMAPEQARGALDEVEHRADFYALGVIMYEALSGRLPFESEEAIGIMLAIATEDPAPPSKLRAGIPPDLETICLKCLEKAPERRYAGAGELADDLVRFVEGHPITARPAGALERLWKAARRHTVVTAVGLGLVLLLGLAGGLALQGLRASRLQRAREAEERGLVALGRAHEARWQDAAAAGEARAALQEALALDPALARAWRASARLALARGEHEVARERLARVRALGPLDPEALYVAGCLHERAGELEQAVTAFEAAARGGAREHDLAARLARARARVYAARGWGAAAAVERWTALREAPEAPAPFADTVAALLAEHDVATLARLWEDAHHYLSVSGEVPLQTALRSDYDALVECLRDRARPLRERLRAALGAPYYPRPGMTAALHAVAAEADVSPLLREAARASLLGLGRLEDPHAVQPAAGADVAAWVQPAATEEALGGAAQAATLLERAHQLTDGDAPALGALRQAKGPLLRAALPLAVAVAATREGGVSVHVARELLQPYVAGEDGPPRAAAQAALGAIALLEDPAGPPPTQGALRLAERLRELPGLARRFHVSGSYEAALDAALARAPTPALRLAWARAAVRSGGELAAAVERLEPCLGPEVDPAVRLEALTLSRQLRSLVEMPPPTGDPLAGWSGDPVALARARARLEFTARYGLPALAAAGDRIAAVAAFRPGWTRRGGRGAFWVSTVGLVEDSALDLQGVGGVGLLSRFAFAAWAGVEVDTTARADHDVVAWTDHGWTPRGLNGRMLRVVQRWGFSTISCDDEAELAHWNHGAGQVVTEAVEYSLSRVGISQWLERALTGHGPTVARSRRSSGTFALRGAIALRRLVLTGRWDPDAGGRPPAPSAAERREWEAALTPAPGSARIETLGEPPPRAPATLEALRREGASLTARELWGGRETKAPAIRIVRLRGDFELRARVAFLPQDPRREAGLAIRTSEPAGNVFWLFVDFEEIRELLRVGASSQNEYEAGARHDHRAVDLRSGSLVLVLQRMGDFVIARYGPNLGQLVDLFPEPFYFPFDIEVDACLFARKGWGGVYADPVAQFSQVDLLVPRGGGGQ